MDDDHHVVAGSSSQGPGPSRPAASESLDADSAAMGLPPPESAAQIRKDGLRRKFLFMTHLMTNLDALIYVEICTLYYMDCSFFRLLIRALVQTFFLSPKSDEYVLLMPTHRPHVVAVLAPNVLCMLLHLLTSLPEARESARGYLHGGIIIDFVGEKAPTSSLKLLLLDLTIMALQCIMLAVHAERERLRKVVKPLTVRVLGTTTADGDQPGPASSGLTAPTMADHDAEERGVLRDAPRAAEESGDDIELQPLRPGADRRLRGVRATEGSTHGRRPPDMRDYMFSGNAVLGDFHVLRSLRMARDDYQSAAAQSIQSIGYAATWARLVAEPRSRLIRLREQPR